jgi:hypothetical protein
VRHTKSTHGGATPGDKMHTHLTRDELHQLTLFKWRYTLEALGFVGDEVDDLMFLAWLNATARLKR